MSKCVSCFSKAHRSCAIIFRFRKGNCMYKLCGRWHTNEWQQAHFSILSGFLFNSAEELGEVSVPCGSKMDYVLALTENMRFDRFFFLQTKKAALAVVWLGQISYLFQFDLSANVAHYLTQKPYCKTYLMARY